MTVASSCNGFVTLRWASIAGLCHKVRHKFLLQVLGESSPGKIRHQGPEGIGDRAIQNEHSDPSTTLGTLGTGSRGAGGARERMARARKNATENKMRARENVFLRLQRVGEREHIAHVS
jgi:hypothetical protein